MYQVIARKYRPQSFADVVNQEHVKTTLENAILTRARQLRRGGQAARLALAGPLARRAALGLRLGRRAALGLDDESQPPLSAPAWIDFQNSWVVPLGITANRLRAAPPAEPPCAAIWPLLA